MKKLILMTALSGVAALSMSCGSKAAKSSSDSEDFQWQVDQFDDVKVLRYKVNGFDSLTPSQKEMVYYLSQAALAGRDIMYDQNFKHNLAIRRMLEGVYTTYSGDKSTADFANFEKYLKKVWFANGIHHHYSNEKFKPEFSAEYFDVLVKGSNAEVLPSEKEVAIIRDIIFDPSLYASKNNQTEGVDMIAMSASNFYEGVTMAEVEAFYDSVKLADADNMQPVSYGLNSKVVKGADGRVVEQVWKVGGMYGAALEKIVYWLEKAAAVAENEHQKQTLNALISYYKSGDLKEFDRYNILWVQDTTSQIDVVNGFIEVYDDPIGYKATWESLVNFKDIEATKRTTIISDNAQWFEDNSPVDKKYKKPVVKGVSAKVITAAMLGGDCYPAAPMGINLPNADWIRRDHGSKSVTIANVTEAYDKSSAGTGFLEEFILDPKDQEVKRKWGAIASDLHTDLHECLGHGSGQLAPGIKGDELKNYGSPLEETRADLFALYYMADPKAIELGIVPDKDVARAEYLQALLNGGITQITRIEPGKDIQQAHMRNRALIANWALELGKNEKVAERVKVDGKTYIKINDYDKLRTIFGNMLREIQRIKSEGDYAAGKKLIDTYGVKIDPELHKEVLERYAALKIAPYSGFINPVYVPVMSGDKIVDVKVEYPGDYVKQHLDYSKNWSFLPSVN